MKEKKRVMILCFCWYIAIRMMGAFSMGMGRHVVGSEERRMGQEKPREENIW